MASLLGLSHEVNVLGPAARSQTGTRMAPLTATIRWHGAEGPGDRARGAGKVRTRLPTIHARRHFAQISRTAGVSASRRSRARLRGTTTRSPTTSAAAPSLSGSTPPTMTRGASSTAPRTSAPSPPGDPDFTRLYRRRNDAESINRALDDTLFLRRAHSVGHERQHLNLLTYALTVNGLAIHRHCPNHERPAERARRLSALSQLDLRPARPRRASFWPRAARMRRRPRRSAT